MPITKGYAPEVYSPPLANKNYHFPFNFIEQSSIEVYEIITKDGVDYRYLVPITDYKIQELTNRPRYAVKDGGRVIFSRPHSLGITAVSIERNTLIDQVADWPKHASSYNGRTVGIAFDKATMIFQEIAERKCGVVVSTPITQEVDWTAYDDFKASVLKFSVDKLYQIALEIDESGEDCSDNLEGT